MWQVSTLLYCLGEEADDVLTYLKQIRSGDYTVVTTKFDKYFKVRENIIFEHSKFNCHNQLVGKNPSSYRVKDIL